MCLGKYKESARIRANAVTVQFDETRFTLAKGHKCRSFGGLLLALDWQIWRK